MHGLFELLTSRGAVVGFLVSFLISMFLQTFIHSEWLPLIQIPIIGFGIVLGDFLSRR
jgi:RsiW-degrading membrane proteinase PrsW (M82 family)